MNVYDFDETLFTGDTEDYFFEYMFQKPGFFLYRLNFKLFDVLWRIKIVSKTKAREHQYSFLRKVDNLDAVLKDYWDIHEKHLKPWYNKVKQPSDVIASGTPRFLMEPILKRMGLTNLVATEMDPRTGKIDGDFAVDAFKVDNYRKLFPLDEIDAFYSDAYSDRFLAAYAKTAYIVHDGEEITEWDTYFQTHKKK